MAPSAIETAEDLSEKLLALTDRRVALSDSDAQKLSSALKSLDSAQREIDLAVEAKGKLIEQQLEMKAEADSLRAKQQLTNEKSILASAVADRKLDLFRPKLEEAEAFIGGARTHFAERWWSVKTVVRFALEDELKRRTAIVLEILNTVFEGANPEFLRTQLLFKSSAISSLSNLLIDVTANSGLQDTSKGTVHLEMLTWARALESGNLKI